MKKESTIKVDGKEVICGKCNKAKGYTKFHCNCGRPMDYGKDMIEKAKKYLASCIDEEVEREKKDGWVEYKTKVKIPTIEGLSVYLKVTRDCIYNWEKEYAEFYDIISELRAEQAERLIDNGLSGDYNPTITKVLLTKHGYIDKQDVTSDGKAIKGNSIIIKDFSDATGN